jgi:hypothetical protein
MLHLNEESFAQYSNCKCNLFAVHKSKLEYNPVDIDIVTYMLSNIIYILSE